MTPLGVGCMTEQTGRWPEDCFRLSPDSLSQKAVQTRIFETTDDRELLSASAAVLQDLGFHIEESVRELGFMRAAKERNALEKGQTLSRALGIVLTLGSRFPIDLHQKICASLVAQPSDASGTHFEVRVKFYRLVWKGDGSMGDQHVPAGLQRMEMIPDEAIYQQFFAKLSKAVFLEAYTL